MKKIFLWKNSANLTKLSTKHCGNYIYLNKGPRPFLGVNKGDMVKIL